MSNQDLKTVSNEKLELWYNDLKAGLDDEYMHAGKSDQEFMEYVDELESIELELLRRGYELPLG